MDSLREVWISLRLMLRGLWCFKKSKKRHAEYRSTHRSYSEGQRQVQTNQKQVQTSQRQVQPQKTYNYEHLEALGGDRRTKDTLKEMTAVQAAPVGHPGPRFPNAPPPREIRI